MLVTLTPAGRRLSAEVAGHFAEEVATLLRALAPEQRAQLGELVGGLVIGEAATRRIDLVDTVVTG